MGRKVAFSLLLTALTAGPAAPIAPPAAGEQLDPQAAVVELDRLCVESRRAFLQGGTVAVRLKPRGRAVQVQRYDPRTSRVGDTLWPTHVQKGVGTYDRSGYVLDSRLRESQVAEAAGYLGFSRRPWVLARGQYGIAPARRRFRDYLRTDLLAPDRFVDVDSTSVPAQPERCAEHLLAERADAEVSRETTGGRTDWSLSYLMEVDAIPYRIDSGFVESEGLIRSGTVEISGAGTDLVNHVRWTYGRPQVPAPRRSLVVGQRAWIKATDAAALVMDIRYLVGGLEGRASVKDVRREARREARQANVGHYVPIHVRDVPGGVHVFARNPYTGQRVVFEVVVRPVPQAVSRRVR